jgi:threonine dehydrogenase-like Zn-dependent dehydrogenase
VAEEARTAEAFWTREPGVGDIRAETLPAPGPDEVLVRTLHSAVSRGTEALVFRGGVPPELAETMRAPFQVGDFGGPVKYGYLSVGVVEDGVDPGRRVFCLHPHQTRYVVPAAMVVDVPADVPSGRAVLAGQVETAVNALWDAAPRVGDRVAVIGAGVVGGAVAALLAPIPGVRVELVDVDPARAQLAAALGVGFASPEQARGGCDLVVHASATSAGLARALELLGDEGEVIELSWYGDRPVTVPLGAGFHPRRLAIRSSQVGRVAPARAVRWGLSDRLALALRLLADPRFDALLTSSCRFDELPAVMGALEPGLGLRVDYG